MNSRMIIACLSVVAAAAAVVAVAAPGSGAPASRPSGAAQAASTPATQPLAGEASAGQASLSPTSAAAASISLTSASPAVAGPAEWTGDDILAAARKYVDTSDRYLHHSKLHRGMKGYGLTVMAGTELVRFDVEIVSVMTQWGPHQDVILARMSGQDLEKTGIIAGMSGSPVYVRDTDGKDKLIGAVAYGWAFPKEPQCGIQPITQMLAASGMFSKERPTTDRALVRAEGSVQAPAGYMDAALDPRKTDYSAFTWPRKDARKAEAEGFGPRLLPLATPLMVSGLSSRGIVAMGESLAPMGLVPLAAGGVGAAEAKLAAGAKLVPGGGIAIPLVTGDADLSAVGTVTEVIDDRVLAFGHALFAQGKVSFPMGPAYVHTVISNLQRSFKMGSSLGVTGELSRDETVAVTGRIGSKVAMIPMNVTVDWKADGRSQKYHYELCKNPMLTATLARTVIEDAAIGWHEMPEHHTVTHTVTIDFGKLGRVSASNVVSGLDVMPLVSDVTRPLALMQRNPLGEPADVQGIDVTVVIEDVDKTAEISDFKLTGSVYRPGETINGLVTVRPFRKARINLPVKFDLPKDLPEGHYTLTACDYLNEMSHFRREMPQQFDPHTVGELFTAVQKLLSVQAGNLYLRLPLGRGGVALGVAELPDLPQSKARVLEDAGADDAHEFEQSLVRPVATDFVIRGQAAVSFEVQNNPRQTLLRE